MLDQSNDYVKGLAEFFEQAFVKGGGTIVGKETYNGKTDTDFSAILSKVAAASPDLVYLPDYYQTVNLATKQAKDKGINVPFVGGDGWDSSDLDVKAAAGGYFTNHYSPEDPREGADVRERLQGEVQCDAGRPGRPGLRCHDAVADLHR